MNLKIKLDGDKLSKVQRLQKQLNHKKPQTTIRLMIDSFKLE